MAYEVEIDKFEGPMDLLLHLITKNEIDIYDIPINEITTQFVDYINRMNDLHLEVTSEFIVMASTLIEIKSKMLLPDYDGDDEIFLLSGEDPRKELVERLVEYRKYKNIADFLKKKEGTLDEVVFKDQEDFSVYLQEQDNDTLNQNIESKLLYNAIRKLVIKLEQIDYGRKDFFQKIKKDMFTVDIQMSFITEQIENLDEVKFQDFFTNVTSKEEVITTFLALLELLKLKKITIIQSNVYDDIIIKKRGEKNEI